MKNNPKEIQRRRVKGFKLPPNTVCVDRTSKWGNPFRIDDNVSVEMAIDKYEIYIKSLIGSHPEEWSLDELKGKNLACFCPIGSPCHRQILLKLANE